MLRKLLKLKPRQKTKQNITSARTTSNQTAVSTSFQPLAKSPLEPVATANQQDHQHLNQSTVAPELVDKGGSDWWSSEGSSWSDSGDCGGGVDSGGGGCD